MRTFGMQRATIHEWGEVRDECEKSRDDSIRHEWTYPAAMFAAYQSAEVHTHKRRLPARLWILLLAPFLVGLCIWSVARWWESAGEPKVGAGAKGEVAKTGSAPASESGKLSVAAYVAQQQPRIAGLAYTAPAYDEVVRPVRAPYPAACLASKSRCQCYSEQGTRLDMTPELCRSIVEKGFYVAWDATGKPVEAPKSVPERVEPRPRAFGPQTEAAHPSCNTPARALCAPAKCRSVAYVSGINCYPSLRKGRIGCCRFDFLTRS